MCPSRRLVLGGGLVAPVLLAGCGGKGAAPGSRPRSGDPSPPASSAAAPGSLPQARGVERELLAAYEAALRAHPDLTDLLAVPLAHHREHARVLGLENVAASTPPPRRPTSTPRAELLALITRERAASGTQLALAIADTAHGSVLAAVAAAEAVHADLLGAHLGGLS